MATMATDGHRWPPTDHHARPPDYISHHARPPDYISHHARPPDCISHQVRQLVWLGLSSLAEDEGVVVGTMQRELHCISLSRPHLPPTPLQRPHAPSGRAPGTAPAALAAHPTMLRFISIGADDYVRLWRIEGAGHDHTQLVRMQALPRPAGCVCFDATGAHVLVGEAAAAGHQPKLHLFSSDRLMHLREVSVRVRVGPRGRSRFGSPGRSRFGSPGRSRFGSPGRSNSSSSSGGVGGSGGGGGGGGVGGSGGVGLSALRYSPDGRLLAVGCTNGAIHLFDTARPAEPFELRTLSDAASADSGAILSLDWSEDASSGTRLMASRS